MRRVFRWVIHLVMAIVLLVAVISLIAWPVSVYVCSVKSSFVVAREVHLPLNAGRWYSVLQINVDLGEGTLLIETGWPDSPMVNYFIFPPIPLGVLREEHMEDARRINTVFRISRPSQAVYHTAWEFWNNWPYTTIAFPVALPGLILLPIPTTWFAFTVIGPFFRSRHRRKANLCLTCAYPRAGSLSPTCPECGTMHLSPP